HYTLPGSPCSTLFPYTTLFRSLVIVLHTQLAPVSPASSILWTLFNFIRFHFADWLCQCQMDARPTCNTSLVRLPINPFLSASKRSEEHTSELQSRFDLVCRLLL